METNEKSIDGDPCVVYFHFEGVVWPPYHIEYYASLLYEHCSREEYSRHVSVSGHEVLHNLRNHDRHTEHKNQPSVVDDLFHEHEPDDH